ncbi:MAG: alanine/ornithine racemase family PLP-dependent enzyme [Cyclobacteriaceae bacterium]
MGTPRIEINLNKIAHNVRTIIKLYAAKGIAVAGITKGVCGNPTVAEVMVKNGITIIGDSRIENICRMSQAGVAAQFMLIRSPLISQLEAVIEHVHISLNSDWSVIKKLSAIALAHNTVHKIILMVEMGDLREGFMPRHIASMLPDLLKLEGIKLEGIGTNLACHSGIKPDVMKMDTLSDLATDLENQFDIKFNMISGGSSANHEWFNATNDTGRINHLRIGESIMLGLEPVGRIPIVNLYTDAFSFVAEVIESKVKPSLPYGDVGQDAFGHIPIFEDKGQMNRIILGLGRQDLSIEGLTPQLEIDILGASSDHTIIDAKQLEIKTGKELVFDMNYAALLSAMTSPYVIKCLSKYDERPRVLPNGRTERPEAKIAESQHSY